MTGEITKEAVEAVLLRARERSTLLTDCVDDTELVAQHSPLMSPLVWDLAHIGNQEELWLVRDVGGRDPVRSDIDELYDAFKHSRSSRPTLPLLNPAEAREYVRTVRGKVWDVLEASTFGRTELDMDGFAFGMIAQHEQQHAETMLATHQLRSGPTALVATPAPQAARMPELDEVTIPAGPFVMGTDDEPWALDNERTAHQVYLTDFAIDRFPVTNGQFVEFIEDGGYSRPELWSRDGWRHRVDAKLRAPLFWERDSSGWWHETFGVEAPVPPDKPVVHVSFYEAEAYASWAGKRLPTEAEWEKAARWDPESGRSRRFPWGDVSADENHANLGQRHLGPAGVGSYPAGASAAGVEQLIGDVWEWTSSGFHPYPGFRAFPYREYSELFFGGDYKVLRGGSFGTDSVACRGTFRNWDHPIRRQIFSVFAAPERFRVDPDMCRHLGYLGPPRSVRELLHDGENSLMRQSWAPREMRGGGTINADGFGAVWWNGGRQGRYRSISPIWSDPTVDETLSHIVSGSVLAAVRSATEGMAVEIGACAPFVDGTYAFSHNGAVSGWPGSLADLAAEVPAVELLKMPAPTDAALLWTVLRHRLKSKPAEAAVTSLVHDVAAAAPDSRLNLLFGDGQELWATAWGHTLYTRVDESRALIVSEPFDRSPDWEQVPDRHIVCARPGHLIITPIPMGEQ